MLGTPRMPLVAEALAGKNFNSLYFVRISFVKNGKISPRAVLRFPDLIHPIHSIKRAGKLSMSSLDENAVSTNFVWVQSVQTLIIGRLIVVFLLLITTWVWYSGKLELSLDYVTQGIILGFVIAVGLTIVYFFLLRLSKNITWQIWLQFLIDAFLITVLIWKTGDLASPYITLYIVLISVSSIFLK